MGKIGNRFDEATKTFAQKNFDWDLIRSNCKNCMIFHSNNDPYVKLEKAQELAERLNGKLNIVDNAGHFNEAAGYRQFDLLLEKMKAFL